jgi:hypothetical protein
MLTIHLLNLKVIADLEGQSLWNGGNESLNAVLLEEGRKSINIIL